MPFRFLFATLVAGALVGCGSSFTSTGPGDSGPSPDAAGGKDAGEGGQATGDAGHGPVITCGGTQCALATETCCVNPDTTTTACELGMTCSSSNDVAVHCESRADCPAGQNCCLDMQGNNPTTSCQAGCRSGTQPLCNPQRPTCAGGQQCSGDLGGVHLPPNIGVCMQH